MATFPAGFEDLEPFAEFALPTEAQRMARRLATPQATLVALYQTLLPRMEALAEHLAAWPVDDMPPDQRPLLWLGLMFMEAAVAVELFKNPDVPESLDARALTVYDEGIERRWRSA